MHWYPWLTPYYKQTIAQHLAQRAHPAIIIHAHEGMGAESLVWGISRWLMCSHPQGNKTCGQCHGCQLMLAHNHPDWYHIAAEKGKHVIGIDAIREVCDKIWHSPQQGGARVVWIDLAQQLTEAAANALLKTLEEPPSNCWFLLTATQLASLPATLRSRCTLLTLTPPNEEQSTTWLTRENTQPLTVHQAALRLSAGAPAAALALLNSPRWQARTRLAEALIEQIPKQPMQLLPHLMQEDVSQNIHWLMSYLLDALKLRQGVTQWLTNVDNLAASQHLSQWLSEDVLHEQLKQWRQCRYTIAQTPQVNHELLITDTLLRLEAILA